MNDGTDTARALKAVGSASRFLAGRVKGQGGGPRALGPSQPGAVFPASGLAGARVFVDMSRPSSAPSLSKGLAAIRSEWPLHRALTRPPIPTSPSAHRARELALQSRPDVIARHAGEWIALDGAEVVANGRDAVSVFAAARRRGVSVPFIVYVEVDEPGVARLGL